jgi:hypothetical protein
MVGRSRCFDLGLSLFHCAAAQPANCCFHFAATLLLSPSFRVFLKSRDAISEMLYLCLIPVLMGCISSSSPESRVGESRKETVEGKGPGGIVVVYAGRYCGQANLYEGGC